MERTGGLVTVAVVLAHMAVLGGVVMGVQSCSKAGVKSAGAGSATSSKPEITKEKMIEDLKLADTFGGRLGVVKGAVDDSIRLEIVSTDVKDEWATFQVKLDYRFHPVPTNPQCMTWRGEGALEYEWKEKAERWELVRHDNRLGLQKGTWTSCDAR